MSDDVKCTCQRGTVGRSDLKCSECQNEIRRTTKRRKNNYRAHGPCQTSVTRTWRREKAL
jgi:hypothetical protein